MADRVPLAPEVLYPRRLAWRAVWMVLEQYQLEAMALKLNPDDPSQAFPGAHDGEVLFYEDARAGHGHAVARVVVDGPQAQVVIDRIDWLLRPNHRKDFRASEIGIRQQRDVPDVDATVNLAEVIEVEGAKMRTARQRVFSAAYRGRRQVAVVRAFGGGR